MGPHAREMGTPHTDKAVEKREGVGEKKKTLRPKNAQETSKNACHDNATLKMLNSESTWNHSMCTLSNTTADLMVITGAPCC